MNKFGQLLRDTSGMAATEFGLIIVPVCVLLIGGMDVAHQTYVRAVLQGALNDSARRAAVENPVIVAEGDTVEERVENKIREAAGPIAVNAKIVITQQSYSNFQDVGKPEKIMTDKNKNGQYDEEDGDCFEDANDNGEFDLDAGDVGRGSASEVVFYTASVTMPRLFPLDAIISVSPNIRMDLQTAVRNQPFRDKPVSAVICGSEA